ncbi:protein-export chaperone SecB [Gammaproteobacteria bacterium]|nr:protein-export chaperone SecB [Gammaproteobacteria bacterium]
MTDTQQPAKNSTKLDIRQIYIKDLSFESPMSPQSIAAPGGSPKIDINLSIGFRRLNEDGHYEVVLTIEATAKNEGKSMFLAEVQQAGLFQIQGFGDKETEMVLNVACPTVLLPFARAAITDVVSKGGFPQLLVNPVNFESLYAIKVKREINQADAGKNSPPVLDPEAGNGKTIN